MINWRAVPFFRLVVPLILGITTASTTNIIPLFPIWIWVVVAVVLYRLSLFRSFRYRWGFGIAVLSFFFLLGYQLTLLHNDLNHKNHFQRYLTGQDHIIATVVNTKTANSLNVRVDAIKNDQYPWQKTTGTILLYLDKENSQKLEYGDQLLLQTPIRRIPGALNPKALDFRQIYHYQNIHYQAFAKQQDYKVIAHHKGNLLVSWTAKWRSQFLNVLKTHLGDGNEYAIASALILGYKGELTQDIKQAYANTGAIHILAVSGMHVGILLLMLRFLFGFVKTTRRSWVITKSILIIGCLILYALLTGAAPSVVRAVFMFSMIEIGLTFERQKNVYNTILASAFCLLVYNPFYLMQVGFQLSYLAVLGIVYFFPLIYKLLYLPNKLLQFFWKLAAVALAAQLVTFPLGLYYFHQFPVSFLLSGWIAVPLAPVIMWGGILLLFFSWSSLLAAILGKVLLSIIQFLNSAIFWIEQWPVSVIKGIWIGLPILVLLYLMILSIVYAIQSKNFRWLISTISLFLIIAINSAFTLVDRKSDSQIVIYHIYKNSLIDFIDGNNLTFVKSQDLDSTKQLRAAQNYRWFLKVKRDRGFKFHESRFKTDQLFYQKPFLQFKNYRMVIVDEPLPESFKNRVKVKSILVRNSPKIEVSKLLDYFDFNQIIFDGSNHQYKVKQWKEACKELGIDCYDTSVDGAYIVKL